MDEVEILTTALKIEADDQRAAYLDQACAGNTNLRREIEELLCAHVRAGGFLDDAAAAWNARLPIGDHGSMAERPGALIGTYKLIEQIGEGGFGVVFMAEQREPVRRTVALKVIKPGMDSKQVVARFEAERQALAMMDHPNIAKVLDGGTVGEVEGGGWRVEGEESNDPSTLHPAPSTSCGRPYFVMELVRGIPITDYCDQAGLTVRARLQLFVHVCRAVQHAHTKGVIHRDIKPGNVLVTSHDGVPVPIVIDFGVAKALGQQLSERSVHTGFAQLIGTPLYMSPEQAELNQLGVDTRSDIYSLGVLLYELLTGATPFDKERLRTVAFDEMRRILREEEPPRPSTRLSTLGAALSTVSERRGVDPRKLIQTLQGELDWIVTKALEKDRARRYETASALAADVERNLNDEPVEACPPSALYRLRKFARRNRRVLAMAGVITVALVAATGVSVWQAVVAKDAQHQAEADRERAAGAEKQAAAISDFLQHDLLQQVSRDFQRQNGFTANPNLTVREALDRAAARIEGRFQDQPLVEAALRLTIAKAYRGLGQNNLATVHLERSLALRQAHLGAEHPDTLESLFTLAMNYQFVGRLTDTIAVLEQLAEHYKRTFGPVHTSTLVILNALGEAYRKAKMLEQARRLLAEVLEKFRATLGPDHFSTANCMHDLGLVYRDLGRYAEAIALFESAIATKDALGERGNGATLYSMENLARTYEKAGQLEQADKLLRELIARVGTEYVLDTERLTHWRLVLVLKQGKFAETESIARKLLASRANKQPHDLITFDTKSMLGGALLGQRKYAAAEPLLLQGYEGMKQHEATLSANEIPRMAETGERIVRFYEATKQPEKARVWREKVKPKLPDSTSDGVK